MLLRQFLLVKLGRHLCYAYRARSVEAIRLCRALEQDLVTRYGTSTKDYVHDVQRLHHPGSVQSVNFWQSEDIHGRFGDVILSSLRHTIDSL